MVAAVSICSVSACSSGGIIGAPQNAAALQWQETSLGRESLQPNYRTKAALVTRIFSKTKSPVLFVTDSGTGETYMLDVTTLAVVGTITGFVEPQGECSDNKGNVWITDTAARTIYEVSHQGRLENELTEKAYPVSCAVDSATGELAVTNQIGESGAAGNVALYNSGTSPTTHSTPKVFYYNFAGYDAAGNLFIDGRTARGAFALMELAKGSSTIQIVKVKGGKIYFPGMVQWNVSANDLVVGDQSCGNGYASCLHTLSLTGLKATITSTIALQNSGGGKVCDLVQGDIYDGQLFGSDYDFCGSLPSTTYAWSYPAGGAPTVSNATADTTPIGAVVSL